MKKAKKPLKPSAKSPPKLPKVASKKADKKLAKKVVAKAAAKKAVPKKLVATKPAKKPVKAAQPAKKAVKAVPVPASKKEASKAKALTQEAKKKPATEKTVEKLPKAAKAPKKVAKVENEVETEVEAIDEPTENKYNDEEIILTDAEGRRYCRVKDCDQLAAVDAYCRYHYLLFWKKIQVRKKILTEGKLERYVEDLTARYPDKYLEMLRKDLKSEKEFSNAIQELELDDTSNENDLEDEAQSYIEEVRGISSETGATTRDDDEF